LSASQNPENEEELVRHPAVISSLLFWEKCHQLPPKPFLQHQDMASKAQKVSVTAEHLCGIAEQRLNMGQIKITDGCPANICIWSPQVLR